MLVGYRKREVRIEIEGDPPWSVCVYTSRVRCEGPRLWYQRQKPNYRVSSTVVSRNFVKLTP